MKLFLPILSVCFCVAAFGQSDVLGPLSESSTSVSSSGYNQYQVTMQTGRNDLGNIEVDAIIFKWAMQVATLPTDSTPSNVNATRWNLLLNPANENSLIRLIGDAVTVKSLTQTPRRLPDDPWALSAFVAEASDTYNATRTTRIRTVVEAIESSLELNQ